MSVTSAAAGSAARSTSSGGCPAMPRLVVLTSSMAPASASRSCQGSTVSAAPRSRAASASSAASASARARVRLTRRSSGVPGIDQGDRDRARSTAGAEQHRRAGGGLPARRAGGEALHETIAVRVVAEQAVLPDDHGVDRADAGCGRGDAIDQRERRLLVRDREVDAAKAHRRQGAQRLLEPAGRHRKRQVGAIDPMPAQPEAVQARRERMADRPAHHAGERRPARQVVAPAAVRHRSSTPWTRRHSSSPISGRPRIAKRSPSTRANSCAPSPSI